MPERSRRTILVAVWLIASSISATAQDPQPQNTPTQEGQSGTAVENDGAKPFSIPFRIIEEPEAAISRKESEALSRQLQEKELIAQQGMNAATQSMNEATWWLVCLTWAGVAISLIALILLGWNLKLIRQSNKHAQAAANASLKAADAAAKSVDVALDADATMRSFGEMQVRAYLKADTFKLSPLEQNGFFLTFVIENTGSSPAFNIEGVTAVFSDSDYLLESPKELKGLHRLALRSSIQPNSQEVVGVPVWPSNSMSSDFKETSDLPVECVEVLVLYQTTFGRENGKICGDLSFRVSMPEHLDKVRETCELTNEQAFRCKRCAEPTLR